MVLSVFIHITTKICQQIPLGSDAVNKELALMVKQLPSYVDRDPSKNGSRAFVKRSAMFASVGT